MSTQHTPKPAEASNLSQSEWDAHISMIQRAVDIFKTWPVKSAQSAIALEVSECLAAIAKATGSTS